MKLISSKRVKKTRKEHECWGCARSIPAGSEMESATHAYNGKLHQVYWCETCLSIMDEWGPDEREDGCAKGELKIEYAERY